MAKSILLSILLFIAFNSQAQEPEWKELDVEQLEKLTSSNTPTEAAKATYYLGKKLDKSELDRKMELYVEAYDAFKSLGEVEMYFKAGTQLISGYITLGKDGKAHQIIEENINDLSSKENKEGVATLLDRYTNYITRKGVKSLFEKSIAEFLEFVEENPTDKGWYLYYKRLGSCQYMFGDLVGAGGAFEKAVPFIPKDNQSEKAGLLMNIGIIKYKNGLLDEALIQFKSSAKVFEKEEDNLNAGHAYLNVVSVYYDKGQHDSLNLAVDIAMNYYKEAEDSNSMYNALEYKALAANNEQKPDVALKYHFEILEFRLTKKNLRNIGMSYQNIASIYSLMKDYKEQLRYIKKAGEISINSGNPQAISTYYTSMSSYFMNQNNADSALYYAKRNLELGESQQNVRLIIGANLTVGNIYKKNYKQPEEALKYYVIAYDLSVEINLESQIAGLGHNIGVIYEENGEFLKARKYIEASYEIRKRMDNKDYLMDTYHTLSNVYTGLHMYKEANVLIWKYVGLKDSLYSDQMTNSIAEMRTVYETKQIEDSLLMSQQSEENAVLNGQKLEVENSRKAEQIYWLFGILILAGGAIFIAIRSSQQRKKANVSLKTKNDEITLQKEIIEEKNQDIMDSISYAKRIQNAILPPQKIVKEYLKNSFILYKPKDIVAGDFYWMSPPSFPKGKGLTTLMENENINPDSIPNTSTKASSPSERTEERILFAAADCTGHGVPGALVSVICNNALNRSVKEFRLTDPGKILDKTREIVIQEFEKSEEEVKDGMDIALVSLEFGAAASSKQTTSSKIASFPSGRTEDGTTQNSCSILKYAGAHNPLWIVRKGASVIEEIKANKQPIGQFIDPQPYKTHEIELNEGDSFYIFSDGYVDQFGGEKGKKFKAKAYRELLLSIQDKEMEEQKDILDSTFEKWRGDIEQIDDVCVIGVRV